MTFSMAASHSRGKFAQDKIFGASAAANKAAAQFGKDKVVNATIGALLDDNEKLVCLSVVERVFRNLPTPEIINYAPIAGLPEFLEAVVEEACADNKPDAYIQAVATAGGSGVIHHTIWNYSEMGDTILTADWYWGPYKVLADALGRKLSTFQLFNEQQGFNIQSFEAKTREILAKQDSAVILLNTPAHNPTGYSLTDGEWDQVLDALKACAKDESKRIVLMVDIAYIDYAGERNASRAFVRKFSALPANILVILAYSMSKGYTVYGQRTGAMIGISSHKDVITEFGDINQYLSRATWSNINRGCMRLLATIYSDPSLRAEIQQERAKYYQLIQERAQVFTREAREVNLGMLPFRAGFFLSLPSDNPDAVCEKLHDDNIFAVPLAKGVRIAVCAVPTAKIAGMAAKIKKAMDAIK
ncbi:MAG: aminotransferase class I/II-fold pyridoxal phosphate-dependent enzyme [Negativicutes bacterium]|nr:aminotransferase class I/II-fold pyridoxal phosphate-dependent enzyme [Negativicutes bacterium]